MTGRPTLWTPAQDDELGRLWALGMRAMLIGEKLGKTKNAILGRANRTGLPAHAGHRAILTPQERINWERLRQRRRLTGPKRAVTHVRRTPSPPRPIQATVMAPDCAPVALIDATEHQCHYIAGEPAGALTLYCGAPKADAHYCEFHRQICYQPFQKRERRNHLVSNFAGVV